MQQLIHDVFINGFVTAMRPTLAVPVVGLLLAALSCTMIARRVQRASGVVAHADTPGNVAAEPAA